MKAKRIKGQGSTDMFKMKPTKMQSSTWMARRLFALLAVLIALSARAGGAAEGNSMIDDAIKGAQDIWHSLDVGIDAEWGLGPGLADGDLRKANEFREVFIAISAEPEQVLEIEVEKEQIAVDEIQFRALRRIDKPIVRIERVDAAPIDAENAFQYFEIDTVRFDDDDIGDAHIVVKVDRLWLRDNSMDPETVAVKRYNEGQWVDLLTTRISEDAEHAHYRAQTPGFSYFAITAKPAKEEKGEADAAGRPTRQDRDNDHEGDKNGQKSFLSPTDEMGNISGFAAFGAIILIVLAGAAIIIASYIKRSQKDKVRKRMIAMQRWFSFFDGLVERGAEIDEIGNHLVKKGYDQRVVDALIKGYREKKGL